MNPNHISHDHRLSTVYNTALTKFCYDIDIIIDMFKETAKNLTGNIFKSNYTPSPLVFGGLPSPQLILRGF